MTHPPKIIVFGGSSILVDRMEREMTVVGFCRHFHLDVPLDKAIIDPDPSLFVIIDSPGAAEALARLREIKGRFRSVPVLMIARRLNRRDITRAYRLGVDDILLPPFQDDELLALLRQLLQPRPKGPAVLFRRWLHAIQQWFYHIKSKSRTLPAAPIRVSLGLVPKGFLSPSPFNTPEKPVDLYVRFFGELHLTFFGVGIHEFPGKKISSLLAYLLYHHTHPLHREVLMAKFWGQSTPSSARNSLNVALHKIRQLFHSIHPEPKILQFHDESYQINPGLSILTDVGQFSHHWKKGRQVERTQSLEAAIGHYNQAIALYQGDFLEAILFEEWCESERDNMKETYLFMLNRLSDYLFQQESYTASINVCRKILQRDPCLEETHRRLIICYDRLGMRDRAIRQYYRCEEALAQGLSVRPSDHTRALFDEISCG